MDGWPRHGLVARLRTEEANAMLREGGYELRVEHAESGGLRLVGRGAGLGVPLPADANWADLYGALVRLRRTRQHHDPAALQRLTRWLGDSPEPPDPKWVTVPEQRVERLTAPDLSAEAACCLTAVDGLINTGKVLFPAGGPVSVDGRVQMQVEVSPARAQHQLRGWSRLARAVETDPVLRMHCATQPVAAALVDVDAGSAALSRATQPVPPHPQYPGGTVAVGLPAFLRGSPGGLLRHVIANRFERREDELGYFLEHFVRPLLRVFRLAIDSHHIGLLALHADGVGFELSPELESTGRIVVTDYARVCEIGEASTDEVAEGVETLVNTLDALSAAFSLLDFETGTPPESQVRAAVDRVIAEELRYLEAHTADALSGDHPLQCFVHTVPSEQDDVLKQVLNTVQERTRKRRWDARLPRPVVVIDLDLCGIVPLQRTLDAARAISGPRPGAPEGILELAKPSCLPVLPTFAESTWRNFVEVSGLGQKYPQVDWRQVYTEFLRAFSRPWERLRTDEVNAGLPRFVWDVQDAGGQVVFCTGRKERVRRYTEEVLDTAGVPQSVLLCMPDVQTRPISEMKVEKLRELGDIDVVAVFDDVLANRIAITKEFSEALAVAVEVPGLATERQPGQPVSDKVPVIATFETSPRRRSSQRTSGSRLSNTHSLEELQVGSMRSNRVAHRWPVRLSESETMSIVDKMVAEADRAAQRTVRSARAKFGMDDLGATERIQVLHHLFTRKQFLKGSRSNYQPEHMRRDIAGFLDNDRPIEVVLLGFPVKQCLNRLKAFGPLPDLAELGALVRLRELQQAVRAVYPPGLHLNILTDGRHFRPRPAAVTDAYSRKLREYAALAGIDDCATIEEIDTVASRRLGPDLPAQRSVQINRYRRLLNETLRGYDITDNPLRTLESINKQATTVDGPDGPALAQALGMFREILMSVVYSVPVNVEPGADRITWSSLVYSDVYNLTDSTVSPEVRQTRAAVLRRAWHTVIRYLAVLQADDELGYESLFPSRVRLTVSAARRGRCGFTYLGGSGLLPWQGTGVVDSRGQVAADFAISLLDQGFVPVYSDLLGPRQPWMMVPAEHTHLFGRGEPGSPELRLDDTFTTRIRLRRK